MKTLRQLGQGTRLLVAVAVASERVPRSGRIPGATPEARSTPPSIRSTGRTSPGSRSRGPSTPVTGATARSCRPARPSRPLPWSSTGVLYVPSPFSRLFALGRRDRREDLGLRPRDRQDHPPQPLPQPRRVVVVRRKVPPHLPGRRRGAASSHRCGERPARSRIRGGRSRRHARGDGLPGRAVRPHLAHRGLRRRGRLGEPGERRRTRGPERRHPRPRRPDGQGAVALPHRPAPRRARPRDLGGRLLEESRRHQRMVPHERRRGAGGSSSCR